MREDFFKFKYNAQEMMDTVENHFVKILAEIRADFPDLKTDPNMVIEGDSSADEGMPTVNKDIEWSCFICTNVNKPN